MANKQIISIEETEKKNKPGKRRSFWAVAAEILLIFSALAVIVWSVHEFFDYRIRRDRDLKRAENIREIQIALNEFQNKYGHRYPQTPTHDWGFLAENQRLEEFFDFENYRDPCQPDMVIPTNGQIDCQGKKVTYEYIGVECSGQDCTGYAITLWLETGGKQDFVPQDISDKI